MMKILALAALSLSLVACDPAPATDDSVVVNLSDNGTVMTPTDASAPTQAETDAEAKRLMKMMDEKVQAFRNGGDMVCAPRKDGMVVCNPKG